MIHSRNNNSKYSITWSSFFTITCLAVYTYIFMEWLFIVTKPSFMNLLSTLKKVEIFLFFGAAITVILLLLVLPIAIISVLPWFKKHKRFFIKLSCLLPAVVLASLLLLLVDNFTYTIFKLGIVSTKGYAKAFYALLFIFFVFVCYVRTLKLFDGFAKQERRNPFQKQLHFILLGLVLFSFSVPIIKNDLLNRESGVVSATLLKTLPHIIMITSDGLEASHFSIYGYERDTDPRIRQMGLSSLVAENAFPNSNVTASSVISIYTGKYPTQSRFFYPPNILRGANAYEHLPGILRSIGYYSVQITQPYYIDAFAFNMKDGFDVANGRKVSKSKIQSWLNKFLANDFAYFFYEISNRILDRIKHIFYFEEMNSSVEEVTNPQNFNDHEKVDEVIRLIQESQEPVFVHIHLMGTHGEKFMPQKQVFSKGQSMDAQEPFNADFYDDSIVDLDQEIGRIVDELISKNLLERSILIFGTDHGQKWTDTHRIPLIMRFPHGEYAGRIQTNVQNLDIAPTILDYMDIPKPDWMRGKSLLNLEPTPQPVFSLGPSTTVKGENGWTLDLSIVRPPFYDLGVISVIYCEKWYKLDLYKRTWDSGAVLGSTGTCPEQSYKTDQEILNLMEEHLRQTGYDTSTLPDFNLDFSQVNPQ